MFCTSVLWDVSESFEWNSVQVSGSFVSLLDEQGDERLSPSARLLKNAVNGFDLLFWMDTNPYIIDLDAELSFVNIIIYIVPSLCLKAPYSLFCHTSNGIKVDSPSEFFTR